MLLITYNHYSIMLGYILHLVHLCPRLGLYLFMSYICDLFFIFSFVFVVIDHITSLKQTHLFFVRFSEHRLLFLDDNVDEKSEQFQIANVQPQGVA